MRSNDTRPVRPISDLITPEYLSEQRRLHAKGDYGKWGDKWAPYVLHLAERFDVHSILDYGCGQGTLKRRIRGMVSDQYGISEYDPAIAGKDRVPLPADLVVCTDVLEHIEPALVETVLKHLREITNKATFVSISTRPASKSLTDGHNAHISLHGGEWWKAKCKPLWHHVDEVQGLTKHEWAAVLQP